MKVRAKRNEIIAAVVVAALMLTAVSLAAGAQSFGHMYDWARLNNEPHWRALLFPVSVDGTILASTVVLYVDHRLDRPGTPLAYWLLGVGVAISVVANVFHTWQQPNVAARGISAIGPLALFGIFHLFVQFIRSLVGVIPAKEPKAAPAQQPAAVPDQVLEQATAVVPEMLYGIQGARPARLGRIGGHRKPGRLAGRTRTRQAPQPATAPVPLPFLAPPPPAEVPAQLASASAADVKRPQTVTQPTRPRSVAATSRRSRSPKPSAEDLQAAARAYWASERAAGRDPSARQIAAATGASKSSVSRWAPSWTEQSA